jgi:hypothetical protein
VRWTRSVCNLEVLCLGLGRWLREQHDHAHDHFEVAGSSYYGAYRSPVFKQTIFKHAAMYLTSGSLLSVHFAWLVIKEIDLAHEDVMVIDFYQIIYCLKVKVSMWHA